MLTASLPALMPSAPKTPAARPPASAGPLGLQGPAASGAAGDASSGENGGPTDPLENWFDQFSGERAYRVRLNRVLGPGNPAYITTMDMTPDFLEDVKKSYGGGKYQARVLDNGVYVKNGTTQFIIDGPPSAPGANAVGVIPPAAAAAVPASVGAVDVESIVQRVLDRVERPRSSSLDVVALIAALSPFAIELVKGRREKSLSIEDVRQVVESVTAKPASSGTKDVLEAVKQILEVRELLSPSAAGGDSSDAMTEAIRTFGPAFARFLDPNAPADGPAREPSRQLAAGDAAPTTEPAESMSHPLWATELAPHVGQLVRIANEAGDARQLASGIQFFMSPRHKGMLRELLANDNAQEQLVAAFPQLAAFPMWLEEFIDETRSTFGLPSTYDEAGDDSPSPRTP